MNGRQYDSAQRDNCGPVFPAPGPRRHHRRAATARTHHTTAARAPHSGPGQFVKAAYDSEKTLLSTFLLTGLRELEVVQLFCTDVSFELRTIRVSAKPELGFYPKRWEEREVPIPVQLIERLKAHTRRPGCNFVFSSPKGNREYHMLDHCKAVAKRAGLDPAKFDLKTPLKRPYCRSSG